MAQLILRNVQGLEVGRRSMEAAERYHVYACCQDGTPLTFGPSRYHVKSAAWRKPEEELVCLVTWLGWATTEVYEC